MDQFESDMYKYIDIRIEQFGSKIQETLMRNVFSKRKGKWDCVPKELLILKLKEEFSELIEALEDGNPEHITLESTDVAAVCMMLHDNFGKK